MYNIQTHYHNLFNVYIKILYGEGGAYIVDTRHYIMAAGSTSRESAGFLPTGMTMGNSTVGSVV